MFRSTKAGFLSSKQSVGEDKQGLKVQKKGVGVQKLGLSVQKHWFEVQNLGLCVRVLGVKPGFWRESAPWNPVISFYT